MFLREKVIITESIFLSKMKASQANDPDCHRPSKTGAEDVVVESTMKVWGWRNGRCKALRRNAHVATLPILEPWKRCGASADQTLPSNDVKTQMARQVTNKRPPPFACLTGVAVGTSFPPSSVEWLEVTT
ncbi:predicted protein [Histoplasma mississippiense (nom. inval.)]|uniref:predicted protein n=1 Tax=Ajellomyces capsulatus (strain NAm1 / WU24) TaxID=2059318 RepID=UPI000157C46D|nr:predicted protein [Histoplasma mississippiense (nom. inval.)]EDN08202.1 predicted protein [Histoplasma mississippiense (nom. inval.)]